MGGGVRGWEGEGVLVSVAIFVDHNFSFSRMS